MVTLGRKAIGPRIIEAAWPPKRNKSIYFDLSLGCVATLRFGLRVFVLMKVFLDKIGKCGKFKTKGGGKDEEKKRLYAH